uniref:Uncharacterized protein n=1 Tax=Gossypium raimondii TaxID=29730 RepID=A0A0D2V0Y8_GOSRA|nr:hypothetical protein B456_012G026800 [Gossypium raimondii]
MYGVDACGCGWIQFICPLIWVVILECGFWQSNFLAVKSKGSDTSEDLRIKRLDWYVGNGEKLSVGGCIQDIDHLFIQCYFAQQMYNTIVEMDGVIQEILLAEKKKLNIRLWMHIKQVLGS